MFANKFEVEIFTHLFILNGPLNVLFFIFILSIYVHGPRIKFRTRDRKSELGPLLWNKYVFFMKWKKLATLRTFFLTYPLKNKKKHLISEPRAPRVHLDPPCGLCVRAFIVNTLTKLMKQKLGNFGSKYFE